MRSTHEPRLANNNRTGDPSGAPGTYTFNSASQQTNSGYTYDGVGNLTASPRHSAIQYNQANRNTSITPTGGQPIAMTYSGESQIERTSAWNVGYENGLLGVQSDSVTTPGGCILPPIICDPPNVMVTFYEKDPSGELIASRSTQNGDYYFIPGAQGSIVGLVDPNGVIRAGYYYDPYGNYAWAGAANGPMPRNPWRFQAGYLDDSGLYKFGHRYYDPVVGRWTQPDPMTVLGDPGRASAYSFVGGDPVNLTDPSGMSFLDDIAEEISFLFDLDDGVGLANAILDGDWGEVGEILGSQFIGSVAAATCIAGALGAAGSAGTLSPIAALGCTITGEAFSKMSEELFDD